ncbi:MAG: DMT family transporter [bacterium]|nr:DMT family transporter [bacterium]
MTAVMDPVSSESKKKVIGAFAVCIAAISWGVDGVILRPSLYSLDVPVLVFCEHAIAFLFMIPLFYGGLRELKTLSLNDWLSFFWVGLFGGAIGTMAIVGAIFYSYNAGTNIAVVLILQKLQPIFAIILSMIVLKEKPKKHFYFWGLTAVAGSYLLSFGAAFPDIDGKIMVPIMLALLASFSFGSSTVFSKFAVRKISFKTATLTRFGMTTAVMLVVLIVLQLLVSLGVGLPYAGFKGFADIGGNHMLIILIIVFTTGGGAIFLYYFGLKRIMASHAAIYELMFPISSILFEFFVHDKLLDFWQFVGVGLILLSISIISSKPN